MPLGGVGEFGMNMMVIACGDTAILVDAGVTFPEPELLGVDLIIPDFRPLERFTIAALVLTHGHEDHIGAVAHVLPHVKGPIYGTAFTLALVENKLDEAGEEVKRRLVRVKPRERVTIGSFVVEFLRVTHSMPDCVALAIETPRGVVVHTGDFKIDQTPLDGEHVDFHRIAQLGAAGVHVLLADSTNIERRGFSGSELEVVDAFEEIFTSAKGKIVVAMFASSIYRMQILADLAAQFDRQLAFVGRGVIDNSEIAQRLGYLRIPAGVQIRDSDLRSYPAQDVVCICTGSQGEPQAALSRIAIDDHRHVKLDRGRRGGVLGARDSRQREGDRPGDEPRGAPRRRRGPRGHAARPRLGPRQRRGAQAHAFADQAAILRADTRGVPPARPPCAGGGAGVPRHQGACSPRTATSSVSTTRAGGLPSGCRPAGR